MTIFDEIEDKIDKAVHYRDFNLVVTLFSALSCDEKKLIGGKVLGSAAAAGNFQCLKFLIDNGADMNASHFEGITALHWTLEKSPFSAGHFDCLKHLLQCGVNVNAADNNNRTPIYTAIARDLHTVIGYLIENGADLIIKDRWGYTPLEFARYLGKKDIVESLEPITEQVSLEILIQVDQTSVESLEF